MLRASALLAIATGMALALLEFRANWNDWQWWPWWLVDFVAAGLLLGGAMLTMRQARRGRSVLVAAWAFTLGMAWMSLAGNLAEGVDPARDGRLGGLYIGLIVLLVSSAFAGMLMAIFGEQPAAQPKA